MKWNPDLSAEENLRAAAQHGYEDGREYGLLIGAGIAFGLMSMAEWARACPVACNACRGEGGRTALSFADPKAKVWRSCDVCRGRGRLVPELCLRPAQEEEREKP